MSKKQLGALRKVLIEIDGKQVVAWESKKSAQQVLGRWTDPKALLQRIYEVEHPEENIVEGPGRQWQATWRGGFSMRPRPKKAA